MINNNNGWRRCLYISNWFIQWYIVLYYYIVTYERIAAHFAIGIFVIHQFTDYMKDGNDDRWWPEWPLHPLVVFTHSLIVLSDIEDDNDVLINMSQLFQQDDESALALKS